MENREKGKWEKSRYDVDIEAQVPDSATFLYAELRKLLLGRIIADARRCLDRTDGYCSRVMVARNVFRSLRAHKALVMALLNTFAWLDDETKNGFVDERTRSASRRAFEKAMLGIAEICRETGKLAAEVA